MRPLWLTVTDFLGTSSELQVSKRPILTQPCHRTFTDMIINSGLYYTAPQGAEGSSIELSELNAACCGAVGPARVLFS